MEQAGSKKSKYTRIHTKKMFLKICEKIQMFLICFDIVKEQQLISAAALFWACQILK